MRGFTIRGRVFYEWKQKNLWWAPSRDPTTTILAPWLSATPCCLYEKKNVEKPFPPWVRAVSKIYNSIGSMYPYERGSVSTVVCHLFVVRVRNDQRCAAKLSAWWAANRRLISNSAPAKKLKVNLTLPLEVDQTTTMYSWREPSTIAILFCCQAWIGADYEKRAIFFFMSSRDRVAMATLVLDLRMHPFVVPTTIFLDVTHRGLVLALWHVRESEDIAILGSIWWRSPADFKVAAT